MSGAEVNRLIRWPTAPSLTFPDGITVARCRSRHAGRPGCRYGPQRSAGWLGGPAALAPAPQSGRWRSPRGHHPLAHRPARPGSAPWCHHRAHRCRESVTESKESFLGAVALATLRHGSGSRSSATAPHRCVALTGPMKDRRTTPCASAIATMGTASMRYRSCRSGRSVTSTSHTATASLPDTDARATCLGTGVAGGAGEHHHRRYRGRIPRSRFGPAARATSWKPLVGLVHPAAGVKAARRRGRPDPPQPTR